MKKVKTLMSVLLMALFFVACGDDKKEPTPKLKFDPATVEVVEGESATVNVTGGTAPYTAKAAEVAEGAEKVVEVTVEGSKITIEGLTAGETTITVTDKDGIKGEIKVTVTAKEELKFDPETVEVVAEGESATVNVTGGTAPYTIEVAEGGEELINATIEEGVITIEGLKEGDTTITVSDSDGLTGEIPVKVTAEEGEGGE